MYADNKEIILSIRHAHGDLYKHLGIDSSTDLNDRYSNLFLNAYINRHAYTEYLKRLGIWHVFRRAGDIR